MASRLFHAVVGLGIALGTAAVGCDGPGDEATTDTSTSDYTSRIEKAVPCPEVDGGSHVDAGADAANVPFDPFCDVSWPTTKGNASGPTCGDVSGCVLAGPSPFCAPTSDASAKTIVCEPAKISGQNAAWCVDRTWTCAPGTVRRDECSCWKGSPACP